MKTVSHKSLCALYRYDKDESSGNKRLPRQSTLEKKASLTSRFLNLACYVKGFIILDFEILCQIINYTRISGTELFSITISCSDINTMLI